HRATNLLTSLRRGCFSETVHRITPQPRRRSMSQRDDGSILDPELTETEVPAGIDRRAFMMRSAMIGAVAVLSGRTPATAKETAAKAASATAPKVPLSPDLDVVKKS